MNTRRLGRTDINVSEICLGTMTWGEQNTERQAAQQLDLATDRGINFIDAAEMYPVPPRAETQGLTETYLGNWLAKRGRREDLVIASKVSGPGNGLTYLRNGPRLTKDHVRKACEDSLKRLQTDYIDLYQVHWPERNANFFGKLGYEHKVNEQSTPIEETLEALHELAEEGKIRHIGISNETPWGTSEYLRLSRERNWPRIASIQNPYNLLNRTFEVGMAEMACRENVGLLAYSPLAFGVLSGKYLGGKRPEGARLSLYTRFARYTSERGVEATQAYVDLARQHGLSPVQLALAYVTSREFVTSNIIGATSLEQLEENIESAEVTLDEAVLSDIEALHSNFTYPCP
ncbi:NADP(H)-dependent aldo-keto reductase [Marinobacter sp. CHS3-4]|uniref:NADP(H)-dependent aldo-keto reductase n=1 Tax=Marinobacter sp. CHS3-4 TaxID=3045174 RepID=UPI0024B4F088|nr:NADP(H)-dependent aldo-keto reductase [Marinobacter sp. CHS3-4]MDI9246160.1 NADP(H)-dependent aldo-keto reductase [Marinobacter sp. CHS3-4]